MEKHGKPSKNHLNPVGEIPRGSLVPAAEHHWGLQTKCPSDFSTEGSLEIISPGTTTHVGRNAVQSQLLSVLRVAEASGSTGATGGHAI